MSNPRRIARLFKPYRGRLLVVLALIALSAIISLISPFLLRRILDDAIPQQNKAELTLLVGGMIAVSNVTTVIAVIIAMFALDWQLAAFSLALLPFFVWLTRRVGQERKRITAARQSRLA